MQGYKGAQSSLADVVVMSIVGGAQDYQVCYGVISFIL